MRQPILKASNVIPLVMSTTPQGSMHADCNKLKNQPAMMCIYVKSLMKCASKILSVSVQIYVHPSIFLCPIKIVVVRHLSDHYQKL